MSTHDRFENDDHQANICYRSNKGKEYIDIEINILCPACPEDIDQEFLNTEWNGEDYVATCPGCGYTAIIDVQEGARK